MDNLKIAKDILKDDFSNIEYSMAIVQSPEWLLKTKKGHCWEQVELARYLFSKKGILCKTYFMDCIYNDVGNTQTHTFLVFSAEDIFYWFEHSWEEKNGIHSYNSLKDLISDVKNKLSESVKKQYGKAGYIRIREYNAPNLPCGHMEYFIHCLNSTEIKIEDL